MLSRRSLTKGWPLFWLLSALTAVALALSAMNPRTSPPEATQGMVRLAGQIAAPLIYLAFVASPLARLWPGAFSSWLLANRRYIGLAFAGVFTWHSIILLALYYLHPTHYMQNVHEPSDVYLGVGSYVLLVAMAVSSLFPVRRRMHPKHWRILHRVGIRYFWLAVWVTYTEIAMSNGATLTSVVYAVAGAFVLVVRVLAFSRSRGTRGTEIHMNLQDAEH